MQMEFDIFTDGSCKHNGKPECYAGWAFAVILKDGRVFARYGEIGRETGGGSNNKGELLGVHQALTYIASASARVVVNATIYSDSNYSVQSLTVWRSKMQLEGYIGRKNATIIRACHTLIDIIKSNGGKIAIEWVKGHADSRGNQLADLLCDVTGDPKKQGMIKALEKHGHGVKEVFEADLGIDWGD